MCSLIFIGAPPYPITVCVEQQKTSSLHSYLRRDEALYDPWCHPDYRLRRLCACSAVSSSFVHIGVVDAT
jgi:hypothetical protein